ncbi:zinc finger, CCHC-type containing protein [Tanacetum coccineum]
MDESISVSSIVDKLPPSWKDFKHTLKHGKDDLSLVQLGSHLRIEKSLKAQESDKGKGERDFKEHGSGSSFNKKPKLECWKCDKTGHFKRDCRSGNKKNANAGGSRKGSKDQSQDQDRCWFKTYEPVEDGSVLYMGDDHFAPVHGKGSVVLEFSSGKSITLFNVLYVSKLLLDDSDSVYMSSSSIVVNSSLWHARLGHVHYKRMLEMSKDDLIPAIDENMEKFEKDGGTRIQACFQDELDNVVEEEDGGWICFLGGNNSSGIKKYQGSNSSDGGNTEDGVKIAGGVIGSGGGIEFSEKSEEMFPGVAGK